jgi:hypothetical protein
MRYSSARQLELDISSGASGPQPNEVNSVTSGPAHAFPDFVRYDAAAVAASKLAGRINAARISEAELDDLLQERKRLITKKLNGEINRRESNRLEYVRWTLDRIEDARDGHVLEALENSVVRYEQLANDLSDLYENLGVELRRKKTG